MIWLVGAGYMAIEYAKVLDALKREFVTIGRGDSSADYFRKATGHHVERGGLDVWLEKSTVLPESAIISVGIEELAHTSVKLVKRGVKRILLEKPGGINKNEIEKVHKIAEQYGAEVFIAYNRRFYASVQKAKEIISHDGGVLSFTFEFTELVRKVEKMTKAPGIKENWFLGNSTHIVDLAFHLGGEPEKINTYHRGELCWHPSASVFVGSGVARKGALFSYSANWEAPGRWGIEILTKSRRLILQPLEQLQVQEQGSFDRKTLVIDNVLDKVFKPGLYKMVEAFINLNTSILKSAKEQTESLHCYSQMANYQ